MEKGFRVGWMVVNTKESINKERRMVKANIYGKMVAFM
jgi:aspartate/methionine/tyrosine aminotransferase